MCDEKRSKKSGYSRNDASEILGVSGRTVERMVQDGRLSRVNGLRRILIPAESLDNFVAGYNQETPLLQEELEILFDLIKTRIATTVAVLEWRKSFRDKDDPYLELNSNDRSISLLERCMEIPRDHTIQTFKQICAKA